MNPWFSLLRPATDIADIQPGVMLQRVLTYRQERQILHGWDDPTRFHRDSMDQFMRTVLTRIDAVEPRPGSTKRITVLDRAPTPDFYLQETSEVFSSGSAFRSLPNTLEISRALEAHGKVTVIDTAAVSPEEQVRALANTDLLVAQHGAGLANMVWMPPGSAVLEIKPPLVPTVNEIFANLAACRELDHLAVDQVGVHTPIEVDSVIAGAARLLSSPGAEDIAKQIDYLARALKAPRIHEAANRLGAQARDAGWSHEEYLAAVLDREVCARGACGAELRIRPAGFGSRKTIEDFTFDHQPGFKRDTIAHLATGAFLARGYNVDLLGPPGTGETHLAVGASVSKRPRPVTGSSSPPRPNG
jgi:hypothetical protein